MLTLLFFLISTFGLGFTATFFVKNSENFLERNLMRFGFGLSLLPFLGIALNAFRIPADWRIILSISLAYPIYYVFKNIPNFNTQNFKLTITKTDLSIFAMLAIFFVNLYIYSSGAFNYPYLEDDDSWGHAPGVKYYSIEKNAFNLAAGQIRYMNPYPPAYDILLGILHQTNDSVYWTLKFFNAFIISLSTIFFYFFVKEFTGNKNKALFATFALLSIPAFMSHFIWSISLTVPLFFVVFYAAEMIKYDKKWWVVAAFSMVTALTSSPTHSVYFGLFFGLYIITKALLERKFLLWEVLSGIVGLLLSLLFWWGPMTLKYGFIGTLKAIGLKVGDIEEWGFVNVLSGTGDRAYTFSDFFIARDQNMINNPIGIGIVLTLLAVIAVVFILFRFKERFRKENYWIAVTLSWLALTLYAVNATNFSIKLSPFRVWMLLAIPVCILAAEGAFIILNTSKKYIGNIGKYAILLVLLIGIYFTSTHQKIAVNTATWPPGGFWTSEEEIGAYVWMKDNLPKNSRVFTFLNNGPVIGMDMYECRWCSDVKDYQKKGFNETVEENYNWLKNRNYQYFIIDGQTAQRFGPDNVNKKIAEISSFGKFQQVFRNNGAVIFKI